MLSHLRRMCQRRALLANKDDLTAPQKDLYEALKFLLTSCSEGLTIQAQQIQNDYTMMNRTKLGQLLKFYDSVRLVDDVIGVQRLDQEVPKWREVVNLVREAQHNVHSNIDQLHVDIPALFTHVSHTMMHGTRVDFKPGEMTGVQVLQACMNPSHPKASHLWNRQTRAYACIECRSLLTHLLKCAKQLQLETDNKWAVSILRLALAQQKCHHQAQSQKKLAMRDDRFAGKRYEKFNDIVMAKKTQLFPSDDMDGFEKWMITRQAGYHYPGRLTGAPLATVRYSDIPLIKAIKTVLKKADRSQMIKVNAYLNLKRGKIITYNFRHFLAISASSELENANIDGSLPESFEFTPYQLKRHIYVGSKRPSHELYAIPGRPGLKRINPLISWRDVKWNQEQFRGKLHHHEIRDAIQEQFPVGSDISFDDLCQAVWDRNHANRVGAQLLHRETSLRVAHAAWGQGGFVEPLIREDFLDPVFLYHQLPKYPISGKDFKLIRATEKHNKRVKEGIVPNDEDYDSEGDPIFNFPAAASNSGNKRQRI